jgi:hypothetical protein
MIQGKMLSLPQHKSIDNRSNETRNFMFKIKSIISGNEITVVPEWEWKGTKGNKVLISGYGPDNRLDENLKIYERAALEARLKSLLPEEALVQLSNPIKLENNDTLLCEVLLEGVNIANYFPEYRR